METRPGRFAGVGVPRFVAHVLGNLLLGVALGIVGYYLVTAVESSASQRMLAADIGSAATVPDTTPQADPLDWTGYAEEDLAYWRALPRDGAFGRLVAPAMGLDAVVVKGHERQDLKMGPGWIGYTDLPGPTGNCGIAGHRTTYGAWFGPLQKLVAGDTIDLYSPFRRYRYEVTGSERVTPDKVEVMASTPEPQLTLSACDPPYSARYRLIVHARLVEVRRLESSE